MWSRSPVVHAPWSRPRRAFALVGAALAGAVTVAGCTQSDGAATSDGTGGASAGAGGFGAGASGGGAGVVGSGGSGGVRAPDSGAGGTAHPSGDASVGCNPDAIRDCGCIGLDGLPAVQHCLGDGSGFVPCVCKSTQACVPGTTLDCAGGKKECLADGSGYGPCVAASIQCPDAGTCSGGVLGATLQACCLPGGECGLDLAPAHGLVAAIPSSCTAVAQPGTSDATCPVRSLVFPAGSKDLAGCCRPDHTCGIVADFGTADLGCVEPTAWGFPAGAACGAAQRCQDLSKDGSETDVDCGGPDCHACGPGLHCAVDGDCTTGWCSLGLCSFPDCNDGVKNGTETGTDCGGGCGRPCPPGSGCQRATDCASIVCTSSVCQPPTCTDGVMNGDETGVDCGGIACAACPSVPDAGTP